MKPYYEHAGITIYHGDCREILNTAIAALSPAEVAIVCDPPYGMSYVPMRGSDGSKRWNARKGVAVIGDASNFDPAHLLRFPQLILWGAHWYAAQLPASGGWLVWDKTPKGSKDGFFAGHCDLAWTNLRASTAKFSLQWGGEARGGEGFYHPTQKPVALMGWCIDLCKRVGTVVDPYCGSGPTLAAAKLRGIPAIGIEIEERYCEIAAERLSQEVFDF